MGAAEPTKATPQLTEGTSTAARRPEARCAGKKVAGGGRRRPEAAGGGRRRPEAAGGDRRRSPSKKPAFLIQIQRTTKKSAVAKQPQQPTTTAPVLAVASMPTTAPTPLHRDSAREAAQRREEAQCRRRERRTGRKEHPQSTTHNDTNDSSSAGRGREERTKRDAEQSGRPEIEKGNSAARSL